MSEPVLDLYADEAPPLPPERAGLLTPFGVVLFLTAALMLAVVGWGIYQNSLTQEALEGGLAPDFTLPLLAQEGNWQLSAQRGQVVVINFWGSWCAPCREEAPMLQALYEDYVAQGVIFVGVAVKDVERDALAYLAEFGITYPNVMDKGGVVEERYRTQGVPETFVIGKDGVVREFFFARPRESDLRQAIEEALAS
jgi:cytochrome c biogenesis protein CcmG/thiol:disulfide interchange protein DsbE